MKKVLIVTALGGFIRAFLKDDIKILQKMGYEVHCAANNNDSGLNGFYNQLGVIAHHIDMDSSKPLSYETLVSYKQLKKLIESNSYDAIHCHTPIAGALSRLAGRKMRKKGTKIIYTTHGFYFHKGSSRRSWLIYYNIEKFVSRFTDVIITINQEDYQAAKTMLCRDVRYINGVGINTDKFITTVIDKAQYRDLLGVDRDAIMILSIGELSVRKNHQIIIHALSKVKYNNIVYVICGTGINGEGTAKDLEELAEKLKVNLVLL